MPEPAFKLVSLDTEEIDEALRSIALRDFEAKWAEFQAREVTQEGLYAGEYADLGVRYTDGGFMVETTVMRNCVIDGRDAWQPFPEDPARVEAGMFLGIGEKTKPHDCLNVWPISRRTFKRKYEPTDDPEWWRPKGIARILPVRRFFECSIEIIAPWPDADGNPAHQTSDRDGYIVAPVDPNNVDDLASGQRYLLAADQRGSYRPLPEVYGADWRSHLA